MADPKLDEYEIAGKNLGSIKRFLFSSKTGSQLEDKKANNQDTNMSRLFVKDLDLIQGMKADELIKKFSVSPSKAKVLDKLLEDYKKGHLSVSSLTDKTKNKKKRKLNKEKLNKMINDYEEIKRRRKSRSSKMIEKLKEMDPMEIRKRFSLSSLKYRAYTRMAEEYKNKKLSFSKLNKTSHPSKISKGQVNQMLEDYETHKKKLSLPFSFHGKLPSLEPVVDDIKNTRFSISSLKKKVFK